MDVTITEIRQNKGTARVWLQGNTLLRSGFAQGTKYKRVTKDGAIVLTRTDDAIVLSHLEDGVKVREVSGRIRNDKQVPIIDINNDEIGKLFEGMTRLRVIFQEGKIVILPLASEIRAKARLDRARARIAAGYPLKMGSFAHGGGVLTHALEAGFAEMGIATKLMVANEFREDLIDHVMEHNSAWSADTISLCGPMQEFAYDANVMQMVATHIGDDGELDVLEAGIPCSGASLPGRAKRGLVHAEAHPEVGHLIAPFIALLARFNASTILLENVTQYQNTASMDILRTSLRDLGYEVHETIVNGGEWNALEHRERLVMVAVTRGMSFDFANLCRPVRVERKLSEILEDLPLDHPSWSEMRGLKAKEIRDKEAGKSFAMQVFDGASLKINTLTKGIGKNRSTDPKIQHPTNPNLLRIPTSVEHARAKDIPEELIDGLCATTAHELLGQSINYKPFVSVGKLLGASYKSLRSVDFVRELQAKLLTEAVLARAKQMARHKMH
jgi:DNA (cytosine-5)-methyltransferase 1